MDGKLNVDISPLIANQMDVHAMAMQMAPDKAPQMDHLLRAVTVFQRHISAPSCLLSL
jgi:hypothetical protein